MWLISTGTKKEKEINLRITGSGNSVKAKLLLPKEAMAVKAVMVNELPVNFTLTGNQSSGYLQFNDLLLTEVQVIKISYR